MAVAPWAPGSSAASRGLHAMTSKNSGPTSNEEPRADEAAIPAVQKNSAVQKNIDATAADGWRTSLFAALKGGWLKTAAEVAGVLSLVVAVIAIVVQSSDSSTPDPPIAPSPVSGQEFPVTRADFTLFDDFSGSEIDSGNWGTDRSYTVTPYAKDGKLHLEVAPQDGQEDNYVHLRANLQRAITDVVFEMTLESREGANMGGGYIMVYNEDGRQHKVALKSGTDSPYLDYYICEKPPCNHGTYEDFRHPDKPPIQVGRTYRVHIYQDDRGWIFDVDGFLPVIASGEDDPIKNLVFYLYSDGAAFHVTVDNVQIAYTLTPRPVDSGR